MSEVEHWFQKLQQRCGLDVAEAIGCYVNAKIAEHCIERHDTSHSELCLKLQQFTEAVCERDNIIADLRKELELAKASVEAIKILHEKDLRKITELQDRNDRQASTINMYRNAIADMKAKLP